MYFFIISILSLLILRPLSWVTGIDALRYAPLIVFVAGVLLFFPLRKGVISFSLPKEKKGILLYFLVAIIYAVSLLRVSESEFSTVAVANYLVQFILIFFFYYMFLDFRFFQNPDFDYHAKAILKALIFAYNLFLLLNFFVYWAGITAHSLGKFELTDTSVFGSLFGLNLLRDSYFLTEHPNTFGSVLAMLTVVNYLAFFYLPMQRRAKLFLMLMLGICAFSFIVIDSRGSLAATGGTILMIEFLRRFKLIRTLPKIAVFIPLVTLVFISFLQFFAKTDYASEIARNPSEFATANNRGVIWKYCIEELQDFKAEHIFGYGQAGHLQSGISKRWSRDLDGWESYTHNFLFQIILDMGYLGLILILAFIYVSSQYCLKLYRAGYSYFIVFLGVPIVYLLSGIMEAPFGVANYLFTNTFFVFFLIPVLLWDLHVKSLEMGEPEKESEEVATSGKQLA